MKTIHIPPLGWFERVGDWFLVPVMYLASGTLSEEPQRTHPWNHTALNPRDVESLNETHMIHSSGVGDVRAGLFWGIIPLVHLPLFGGWKRYVVLAPYDLTHSAWHVGWIVGDEIHVTKINIHGSVRMLLGPEEVTFFGIDAERGIQIPIRLQGSGEIGDEGPYSQMPLL